MVYKNEFRTCERTSTTGEFFSRVKSNFEIHFCVVSHSLVSKGTHCINRSFSKDSYEIQNSPSSKVVAKLSMSSGMNPRISD